MPPPVAVGSRDENALMGDIVFVSHTADRTGAPLLLLNFLRWYKTQGRPDFLVVLIEGGDLEAEFRETAEALVWTPRPLPEGDSCPVSSVDQYHLELVRLDLERADLANTVLFTGSRQRSQTCPIIASGRLEVMAKSQLSPRPNR